MWESFDRKRSFRETLVCLICWQQPTQTETPTEVECHYVEKRKRIFAQCSFTKELCEYSLGLRLKDLRGQVHKSRQVLRLLLCAWVPSLSSLFFCFFKLHFLFWGLDLCLVRLSCVPWQEEQPSWSL